MSLRPSTILSLVILLFTSVGANADDGQRVFSVINAANGLADNSAQIVVCTKTGRMIISTIGNINFYDGAGFSHTNTQQEFQYPLQSYHGNYHLYFDTKHHLWLKNTNSVTCVDLLMEEFVPDVSKIFSSLGYNGQVNDMFVDNAGQVWVLSSDSLICTNTKQSYQVLRDRNLQDLDTYEDMVLLFYDDGEEVGLDKATGRIRHRTRAYEWELSQKYDASSVILRDSDDFYQIRNGSKESLLLHFNVRKGEWQTLMTMDYHLNNLSLKDSVLYMASEYGYWTYDLSSGKTTHYKELTLSDGRKLSTDINTLCFDKQGGMWIGTERRGLLYARPMASPFHALTWDNPDAGRYAAMMDGLEQNISEFKGKAANCMYIDSRNWTWFGTTTGLYMFKTPKSDPLVFDKTNGLLNNVIHSVVEDLHHNVWVATSCGISCILFGGGEEPIFVNSFNDADNVPNESFINCKAISLDDGNIVMQSLDHVVKFHPDSFGMMNDRKPFKLYPKLVKILVNGNFVSPRTEEDGNIVIDRAITRVKDISVNHDQNSVSLTFSALNYFRPLQTYYKLRIKGYQDEWRVYSYYNSKGMVDYNGMLHLPVQGLPPGDYDIEVYASMFPDVWTGKPYVWTLHVNQPWWQTTGMLMLVCTLALCLLIINFILYNRNTRMRMRRNSEEGDVVRRIQSFVERIDALDHEMLAPRYEEIYSGAASSVDSTDLPQDFINVMKHIAPYIRENSNRDISMQQLSKVAQVDIVELYETISSNIYKSPLTLVRLNRLEKAATLLATTDKSIEEIAVECGFYTPNYFIGNFFHEYKFTPREYREEHAG